MFSTWGTVYADVSAAVKTAGVHAGRFYHQAEFQIVILFGGPEIKAQISWQENVSLVGYLRRIYIMIDTFTGRRKKVK